MEEEKNTTTTQQQHKRETKQIRKREQTLAVSLPTDTEKGQRETEKGQRGKTHLLRTTLRTPRVSSKTEAISCSHCAHSRCHTLLRTRATKRHLFFGTRKKKNRVGSSKEEKKKKKKYFGRKKSMPGNNQPELRLNFCLSVYMCCEKAYTRSSSSRAVHFTRWLIVFACANAISNTVRVPTRLVNVVKREASSSSSSWWPLLLVWWPLVLVRWCRWSLKVFATGADSCLFAKPDFNNDCNSMFNNAVLQMSSSCWHSIGIGCSGVIGGGGGDWWWWCVVGCVVGCVECGGCCCSRCFSCWCCACTLFLRLTDDCSKGLVW